jgi:uncharacterized membrane protein (UPF0127 family)
MSLVVQMRRKSGDSELVFRARRKDHPEGVRLRTADGRVLCERCELATTFWTRFRGLMGRGSLPAGEGMLFHPGGEIHMFFMRFAIDAVFCDRELRVVKVVHGLAPWRMAAARGASIVVELPAGAAEGVAPGDRLQVD